MMPAGTDRNGFTLIELVVVMVLISTLTAFALPRIRSSLFTDQLTSAARRFIGLVAEVGADARAERAAVVLRYDPSSRRFTTAPAGKNLFDTPRRYPEVQLADTVHVTDVSTVHGGRQSMGALAIEFSSLGYVDKTIVHFRDDDGRELSVVLSPFLGVTRVLDGYVSLEETRWTIRN
jgi:general secretion pathway protein H